MPGHQIGFWRNPWHNRSVAIANQQSRERAERWDTIVSVIWWLALGVVALGVGIGLGMILVSIAARCH